MKYTYLLLMLFINCDQKVYYTVNCNNGAFCPTDNICSPDGKMCVRSISYCADKKQYCTDSICAPNNSCVNNINYCADLIHYCVNDMHYSKDFRCISNDDGVSPFEAYYLYKAFGN